MSQTTQQNASSSEELAATAEEMSSQAEQLQQAMAFFKLDAGHSIKAAAGKPFKTNTAKRHAPRTIGTLALAPVGAPDEADFARF
jgi:methyl-accepting chemotaxis protein